MKTLSLIIAFAAVCLFSGCQHFASDASSVKTDWMTLEEFNTMLAQLEQKEDGKNFWDRGHWVDAVKGRWHDGIPEYQVTYSAVPENDAYWWYWWFNQPKESFQKHVHEMADKGFTLVYHQSFERPGGDVRYQGVWHKLKVKE